MSTGDDPSGALIIDVLGSGCGKPTAARDTSSLLVGAHGEWTLVDCPGSVVHKLAGRGREPDAIARVILTHNHVDHIYGLPHLLHALAIAGATDPLPLFAPEQTLATVRAMVELHRLDGPRYPALALVEVEMSEAFELPIDGARVRSTPGNHGRDTVAVRFDLGGASACYSSDTAPSPEISRLAAGVDLLLHDCGGLHRDRERFGGQHSSAREAGEVARRAGAGGLVLMHLCEGDDAVLADCAAEAAEAFGATVELATDGARWAIPEASSGAP